MDLRPVACLRTGSKSAARTWHMSSERKINVSSVEISVEIKPSYMVTTSRFLDFDTTAWASHRRALEPRFIGSFFLVLGDELANVRLAITALDLLSSGGNLLARPYIPQQTIP